MLLRAHSLVLANVVQRQTSLSLRSFISSFSSSPSSSSSSSSSSSTNQSSSSTTTSTTSIGDNKCFAIVDIQGHQFKVMKGDRITTQVLSDESVRGAIGERVSFSDRVLMAGAANRCLVGTPFLPSTSVRVDAVIEEYTRADKIIVFKKRRRKKSQRTQGHRQWVNVLRVDDVALLEAESGGTGDEGGHGQENSTPL